jgi:hypothetical protein
MDAWLVGAAAVVCRNELLCSVIPEDALSDLMVTKPFLRSLGYWQAVFRSSLRELDPGVVEFEGDVRADG